MKHIKNNILTVAAVLAICLTAFTKAMPMGKRTLETNCYRTLVASYTDICTISQIDLRPGVSCPPLSIIGRGLSVNPGSFISSPVVIECEGGSFFCCADIVVDLSPCSGQPNVIFRDKAGTLYNAKAKIADYYCKQVGN